MSAASSARLRASFRHPFLLAAVVGIAILAVALWISGGNGRWISSGGPFVKFEIRLPPGILLPPDRDIEMTFWSDGLGRGCRLGRVAALQPVRGRLLEGANREPRTPQSELRAVATHRVYLGAGGRAESVIASARRLLLPLSGSSIVSICAGDLEAKPTRGS